VGKAKFLPVDVRDVLIIVLGQADSMVNHGNPVSADLDADGQPR